MASEPEKTIEALVADLEPVKRPSFWRRLWTWFMRLLAKISPFHGIFSSWIAQETSQHTKLLNEVLNRRRLEVGEEAPDFMLKSTVGREVSLGDYRGKKVWLVFYRYASCPLCLLHLYHMQDKLKEIRKAGVEVIVIYESFPSQFPKQQWMADLGIPMVSDFGKYAYKKYGAFKSFKALLHPAVIWMFIRSQFRGFFQGRIDGQLGQVPAHFLITPQGKIHTAYYGKSIADHIPIAEVEAFGKEG